MVAAREGVCESGVCEGLAVHVMVDIEVGDAVGRRGRSRVAIVAVWCDECLD